MKRKSYLLILAILIIGATLYFTGFMVKHQLAEAYNNHFHPQKTTKTKPYTRKAYGKIEIITIVNTFPRMQRRMHRKKLLFFATTSNPYKVETVSREFLFNDASLAKLKKGQKYAAWINLDNYNDVKVIWSGGVSGWEVAR